MDASSILTGQLKSMLLNKVKINYKQIKHNLDNLNQFQIGVLSVLLTLISMQLVYTVFINSSLIIVIFNLLQLLVTIFSVFSFYTWLTIIYGRNWSDTSIYFLFLTCFMSEFIIQFFINDKSIQLDKKSKSNNHNTSNKHSSWAIEIKYSNVICLSTEIAQYLFILIISTLANFLINSKLLRNFLFILSLCVARFCGFIFLFNVIPASVSPYLTYVCALSGVLFSHFIIRLVNELNSTRKTRIEININDEMNNIITAHNLFKNNASNNIKTVKCANNQAVSKPNRMKRKPGIHSFDSFKRRTSLPSIPLKFEKGYYGYFDDILSLIDEILLNKRDISLESLTEHLETIKMLINHAKLNTKYVYNESSKLLNNFKTNKTKTPLIFASLSNNELKNNLDWSHSNSYSADEDEDKNTLSVFYTTNSNASRNRNRRSLPTRSPSLAWSSTTTSANGMPIVENASPKQRSSSLKLPGFLNQNFLLHSISSTRDLIEKSLDKSSNTILYNLNDDNQTKSTEQLVVSFKKTNQITSNDDEDEETTAASSLISNVSNANNKTSDYDSGESPNSSDYNSDTDKLQLKDLQYQYNNLSISNKKLHEIKEECINSEKSPWQTSDLNNLELLDYLHDWNFPIFQMNEKSNNHVLSKMAYKIFERVGLFKSFEIPIDSFICFFSELERGYIDLPYHNKIHAADVLHACYYLTTQPVPGFSQIDANYKERQSLKHFNHSVKYKMNDECYGSLGANFDPLELLALYCAAAMHDFDHPGRNNQFLVSINSPLALLYNDRSVLENHHAAASWRLLRSNSKFNFLTGLDAAEWKRFRFLIIENILATDLNKHFLIINDFNNIIKKKNGSSIHQPYTSNFSTGLDWKNESDRLTVGKMIIKLADINSPLKERELHLQWTERICEEFYQQGEEETRLGIPVSAFMDRRNPQIPKLQENFMSALVNPLSDAYTAAGLLPGILIEDSQTDDLSDSDIELIRSKNSRKQKFTKIFYSELTSNFKTNYEMWCELLKIEEQNK